MNKQAPRLLTLDQLWQFSLQYYSAREIKEACLHLQNHFHGNVNLLLTLKWLDEAKLTFAPQDWSTLTHSLTSIESLLRDYRELRRKLKTQVSDAVYKETLHFELQLEKQQQTALVNCINTLELHHCDTPQLVEQYCLQLGAERLARIFVQPVQAHHHTP
ncbi:MAG: TIGR02444 family protein [Vibrio sp.]